MDLILRTGRRPLLHLPPSGTVVGYRAHGRGRIFT